LSESMIKFLRALWYLVSRLLIWGSIIPLVLLSFYAAMDYMNVRILSSDGLEARAGVIIAGDDPTPLSKVFSKGFLDGDTMLYSNLYRQYIVSDFDYSIEMPIIIIMPWKDTVVLRITEEIDDIEAEVYASVENSATVSETPPEWNNATYDLTLVRYENNWRIVSMEEVVNEPTGSPSQTEEIVAQ
jgi:hypothetical protein